MQNYIGEIWQSSHYFIYMYVCVSVLFLIGSKGKSALWVTAVAVFIERSLLKWHGFILESNDCTCIPNCSNWNALQCISLSFDVLYRVWVNKFTIDNYEIFSSPWKLLFITKICCEQKKNLFLSKNEAIKNMHSNKKKA